MKPLILTITRLATWMTFVAGSLAGANAVSLESTRVNDIAAHLREQPAGFGEPIGHREAWLKLAGLPAFQQLLKEAQATASKPLPESPDELYLDFSKTGNRDRWQKIARQRRGRICSLTLAECLENRGRFLPPIETTIRAICAERTWVMPAHDRKLDNFHGRAMEMDLGATMLAWDLASAGYLLGDHLSAPIRQLLGENLDRRIFQPYRDMVEGRKEEIYWLSATHNWNAVCLAGITGAALATLESRQDRAFYIAAAQHYIRNFLRGFTPDGYCSEGLGYWNYGFGYFVMMAEAIRQATDNHIDLLADPMARKPALFGQRAEIWNGVYPSIADCSPGTQPDAHLMNFLQQRLSLPGSTAPLTPPPHGSLYSMGMYAFLPDRLPGIPSSTPDNESRLRTWFQDGGVLICRPETNQANFAVALKGGHNAEHHNHNDVGALMVVSGRSMVLCDPGSEVYTARTFSSRRYESDVLNSFGHPVPVIAGQLQRTGIEAKGRVLNTEFTPSHDALSLDLSSAYSVPALKRLERHFTYQRQPSASLTVTDRVEFESPQTFETAIITWGRWHRIGTREWIVTDTAGAVRIKLDTGGESFKIKTQRLDADVHTKIPAERIAIVLSLPVKTADVTFVITPGIDADK